VLLATFESIFYSFIENWPWVGDGIRFCICQFDNNFSPPCQKKTRNVHASIKKVKVNKNWHEIRQITFRIWIWYKWEKKKSSKSNNDRQIFGFLLFLCDISQWNWVSCCDTPCHSILPYYFCFWKPWKISLNIKLWQIATLNNACAFRNSPLRMLWGCFFNAKPRLDHKFI